MTGRYAVVTTMIRLRFDCHSTARGLVDVLRVGLVRCGLNK